MFGVYFGFGFAHLLDARAYDHLLFLAVLCAGCDPARWRETLVLVTAFTVGHTASLALAVLDVVRAPKRLGRVPRSGDSGGRGRGQRGPLCSTRVVQLRRTSRPTSQVSCRARLRSRSRIGVLQLPSHGPGQRTQLVRPARVLQLGAGSGAARRGGDNDLARALGGPNALRFATRLDARLVAVGRARRGRRGRSTLAAVEADWPL